MYGMKLYNARIALMTILNFDIIFDRFCLIQNYVSLTFFLVTSYFFDCCDGLLSFCMMLSEFFLKSFALTLVIQCVVMMISGKRKYDCTVLKFFKKCHVLRF